MKSYYKHDGDKLQQCAASEFVAYWNHYYPHEEDKRYYESLYDKKRNLKPTLCENDIATLLNWKFHMYPDLLARILKPTLAIRDDLNLFRSFPAVTKEQEHNHWQKTKSVARTGIIVKAFLFHISRPHDYPILDQHVMRAYIYLSKGTIEQKPLEDNYQRNTYEEFCSRYQPYKTFFFQLVNEAGYSLDPKSADRALFAFGKSLKKES